MKISTLLFAFLLKFTPQPTCFASSLGGQTLVNNLSDKYPSPDPDDIFSSGQTTDLQTSSNRKISVLTTVLQVEPEKVMDALENQYLGRRTSSSRMESLLTLEKLYETQSDQQYRDSWASRRHLHLVRLSPLAAEPVQTLQERRKRAINFSIPPEPSPSSSTLSDFAKVPSMVSKPAPHILATQPNISSTRVSIPSPSITSTSPHPQTTHLRGELSSTISLAKSYATSLPASATVSHNGTTSNTIFHSLGKYYQPSYHLYALVIILTIAIVIVILLAIISLFKCICHRRKFANPKDYPGGFPWESGNAQSNTQRNLAKRHRMKSNLLRIDKGTSPFTHTAEGDWNRLEDAEGARPQGHQIHLSDPATWSEKPSVTPGSSNLIHLHSHLSGGTDYSSTHDPQRDSLTYPTCTESHGCPSTSGPSSSCTTDDGTQIATICVNGIDPWDTHVKQPAFTRKGSDGDSSFKGTQRLLYYNDGPYSTQENPHNIQIQRTDLSSK